MTPCYYCDMGLSMCKLCIHSDTYEEPKQTKPLSVEEIDKLIHIKGVLFEEGNGYLTLHRYNFAKAIEERHGIK